MNRQKDNGREYMRRNNSDGNKKKKLVLLISLAALLLVVVIAGILVYRMVIMPDMIIDKADLQGAVLGTVGSDGTTQDADGNVISTNSEDNKITDYIINIALLGVDATYKPYATDGGDQHTDAMMVVAINMDKNTIDLISIPRDTFTTIPGVKGFYKANAALNAGGGKDASDGAGFKKVSETLSSVLGGVSIDYYYAVEFSAVVEIVDALGGVDFDVDMAYQGQSGNVYQKGRQHLDGDGVMDYIRARKNATVNATDKGRVDRQKRMAVAIFSKLKDKNMLRKLPDVLSAVNKGLYTNATSEQTLALCTQAANVDASSIGQYSMWGYMNISVGGWAFCYTDQANRQALIKQVYGVDVPALECRSFDHGNWLYDNGFSCIRYMATADEVIKFAEKTSMTDSQKTQYDKLVSAYDKTNEAYNTAFKSLSSSDTASMKERMNSLKTLTADVASDFGYTNSLVWTVKADWTQDTSINEVSVDFR